MDAAEQITTEQAPPITPAPDCQNWLALHDVGFSLIPLKAAGKRPYIAWQAYQKKRAPRSKVEAWFTKSIAQISFDLDARGRSTRRAAMTCLRGLLDRKLRPSMR